MAAKKAVAKTDKRKKLKRIGVGRRAMLPTERSERKMDLRDYSILLHGEKKIGKTTLFAQDPDAVFFEFDPPQDALEIYQVHVPSWEAALSLLTELEAGAKDGQMYKTVVLDGIDTGFQLCFKAVCHRLGISHPSDENDFGRSWGEIRKEFSKFVNRALNIQDVSARFICHSQWREFKTRTGGKIDRLVPILTGQAEEVLVGLIDIWMAYTYNGSNRILVVEGDDATGAGHRVAHRFRTTSNESVIEVQAGQSAQEAYKNLVAAFENEQEERRHVTRSKKKLKRKTQ